VTAVIGMGAAVRTNNSTPRFYSYRLRTDVELPGRIVLNLRCLDTQDGWKTVLCRIRCFIHCNLFRHSHDLQLIECQALAVVTVQLEMNRLDAPAVD
jgi:hypothetical protein